MLRELTGSASNATSLLSLELPELSPARVLLYPSVDHIADKICATHARYGRHQRESSRAKDLYDPCVLRGAEDVLTFQLHEALAAESLARNLPIPNRSRVPTSRHSRFEDLSRKETHLLVPTTFAGAVDAVSAFRRFHARSDLITAMSEQCASLHSGGDHRHPQ